MSSVKFLIVCQICVKCRFSFILCRFCCFSFCFFCYPSVSRVLQMDNKKNKKKNSRICTRKKENLHFTQIWQRIKKY